METSSESESWDMAGEAHCGPTEDMGRHSDQAEEISEKLKIFTKALEETNRGLTKVDQKLNLYRDQTEADVAGQILKESNKTESERQVSELKRAVDQKEQERDQLFNRLDKLSSEVEELREIQKRGQTERKKLETLLLERTRSRDKIRSQAIKAVRHWKAKCKRLDETQFQSEKASEAAREWESFPDQPNVLSQKTDAARTELNEILSRLAQHKEELHHKTVELTETSQKQLSLNQETQEVREALAALKEENQSQVTMQAWIKEHQKMEEQTVSQDCCCQRVQDMQVEFQAALEQMNPTHAHLAQQLANEENSRKELQRSSSELQAKLTGALEEKAALEQQLQLEREMHQKNVHNMKALIEDSSINSDHEVQAKMQAHLKAVKASGESDKELCGVLRATLSRTKSESDKMVAQLRTNEEAYAHLQRKYQHLQQELDEKIKSGDLRHISGLEEKVLQMTEQQKQILTIVGEELDATCLNLASNCEYKQHAISQDPILVKNIYHWLAETMTKLRWLCEEVRECVSREESLRKQHQQTRDQLTALRQMWETCMDQLEKRAAGERFKEGGRHEDSSRLCFGKLTQV